MLDLQDPQTQKILNNILQSRKQQDVAMLQMQPRPQQNAILPQQPQYQGNFGKGIQAISDLLGYGNNTTFGLQMNQGGNLTKSGPTALLKYMWGQI